MISVVSRIKRLEHELGIKEQFKVMVNAGRGEAMGRDPARPFVDKRERNPGEELTVVVAWMPNANAELLTYLHRRCRTPGLKSDEVPEGELERMLIENAESDEQREVFEAAARFILVPPGDPFGRIIPRPPEQRAELDRINFPWLYGEAKPAADEGDEGDEGDEE